MSELIENNYEDNNSESNVEDETNVDNNLRPFDPAKISIRSRPMSLDVLLSRMEHDEIELMPDFQRNDSVWKEQSKCRLIESILLRIPLPAFYFDVSNDEKWIVVDGLQRLTAIKYFVFGLDAVDPNTLEITKNKLKLSGLEYLTQFNGLSYDELPRTFSRRLKEEQVTAYLIDGATPSDVKFNIFKRINTGGTPLSLQEIRHAMNQGLSTQILKEFAESKDFKEATDYSSFGQRMTDREFILRFLAFLIHPYNEYNAASLDDFLNDCMKEINSMNDDQIEIIKAKFYKAMKAAKNIFGRYAFRKRFNKTSRQKLNKALFEVWAVCLANLSENEIESLISKKDIIDEKLIALLNKDFEFISSISSGTGNVAKVHKRFETIEKFIESIKL
jgi:hypothetical protein